MNSWYWIILVLFGVGVTYAISKKGRNDRNELTKKGFYGIISVFVVVFVVTIIITVSSGN
ncbi:protein of unknown function [Gracilibacillus orientalis]|uniref:DUF3976 domain-containing protein n=1 Tax=Gracilibacillus orientalis TaxID=334253 RepID=A0A1I4ND35_9BACI|nr:hypothetical protein [Gracilibacillus orientalis]SFM13305.1 protein of unknown function [Gracilibacillus orientalis]